MQYKASLIAVLGLTATTFAAPQLPAVRAVPSNTLSTLPIARDAQNLASPFSNANGAVAKAPVSKVPVPTKNGLVDVAANVHVARSTIAILDVAASIHACKKTVVSDVVSIHALIKSVGTAAAGQQGLAEEIISDLGLIASALTATVDGVLSQTLPTVVNIAVTEVAEVLAILADVQAIVFQIVQVLEVVVAGLVDCMFFPSSLPSLSHLSI